jgi:hypothetical protein
MQAVNISNMEEESWQTIVKKIRVAVSRLRAVKVMDKKLVADKVNRVASKVVRAASKAKRAANKVARAKRVASRATAKFQRGESRWVRLGPPRIAQQSEILAGIHSFDHSSSWSCHFPKS